MATQDNAATARSAFFMVLPPEVRGAILTSAFGGRTVHIQRLQRTQAQAQSTASGGVRGIGKQWLGGLFAIVKSKGKREELPSAGGGVRWYTCICDLSSQPSSSLSDGDFSPATDRCLFNLQESQGNLRSRYWSCTSPDEVPLELAIGAMGWLLTCRQAYNEGVKVLYASNTFHVRSCNLLTFGGFIPQIPETGLSYITSMELVLDRYLLTGKELSALPKSDAFDREAETFEDTLSRIPSLMPMLQKLYIGFCRRTCILKDCADGSRLNFECSKYLTCLVETTVRDLHQMGRSCDVELGLPYTVFDQYRTEAYKQHSSLRMGSPAWRPGMKPNLSYHPRNRLFCPVQDRRLNSGPENGVRAGTEVGYWLSLSEFDFDDYAIRCFGT